MDSLIFLLMMSALWTVYYISIYIYYKKNGVKVKNYDSLIVVRQNCYSFTARYVYLIKIFYGKSRKRFFFLSTISLDFIDDKDLIFSSVKVPPTVLFESQRNVFKEGDEGKAKLLAFILQTKQSLSSARSIQISHDCKAGDVFIYEIKVIDLLTKDILSSIVQSYVKYLTPGSHPKAQTFVFSIIGRNVKGISPSPNPNFPENALFFVFGIHWILFHIQYLINSSDRLFFAKTYDNILSLVLTALFSAVFALTLVTISLFLYCFLIKRLNSRVKGIGYIWLIRVSYISAVVLISLAFGLSAAFKPENKDQKKPDDSEWSSSTFRWFALVIGMANYTLAYFTAVLIFYVFGLFTDQEEYDLNSGHDSSYKSIKNEITENDKQNKTSDSVRSLNELALSSSDDNRHQKQSQIKQRSDSKKSFVRSIENK